MRRAAIRERGSFRPTIVFALTDGGTPQHLWNIICVFSHTPGICFLQIPTVAGHGNVHRVALAGFGWGSFILTVV